MSIIHILPDRVANQIAAGEVVERPASIVKELLENSLDAGASRLDVEVEAGGKRLVRVTDDGCGMGRDDALLAFERHATSKIRQAEDLLEIATLGFRGEALPSIAAVSRVVLETRARSEAAGTRVEIAGGKLRDVKEIAWPQGTRIEARDLFFNTPARRKFLKSESTELSHIASLVTHYALAHPEKSFRLASMSHELVNATPAPDSRTRVYQLLGGQTLKQLIEIPPAERRLPALVTFGEREENEPPEAAGIVRLTGFVSKPEVQRLNRNEVYFFVNRRLVRDRLILHAITEAYRNILPARMFPVALVFLELPAHEVDVNVHPSKTEVRFRRSSFIHDFTRDVIRQAVVAARPVAAFPLRHSAAEPAIEELEAVERLADETPALGMASGLAGHARAPSGGSSAAVERAPDPTRYFTPGASATKLPPQGFTLSAPKPAPIAGRLPLEAAPSVDQAEGPLRDPLRKSFPAPASPWTPPTEPPSPMPGGDAGATLSSESCTPRDAPASLPRAALTARPAPEFPADLRPLGQVEESYIVATNAVGLWIVDQHAAHERILFEKHLHQVGQRAVDAQRLLLPIIVELKPGQQAVFEQIAAELAANGFDVEPFGQRTVAVKTAPAELAPEDLQRLLLEILDGIGQEDAGVTLEVLRGRISASLACRAAIKIHMALDATKMEWLLSELARAESPMACPHGRPVMLRYTVKDLERAFHRI